MRKVVEGKRAYREQLGSRGNENLERQKRKLFVEKENSIMGKKLKETG